MRYSAKEKMNMMAPIAPENDTIQLLPEFFNTIFIGGDIEHETAMEFYRATHYLNTDYPVYLVINTYGGNAHSALAMRAMIQALREKTTVYTYCTGVAYSAGFLLMSCGTKGCRFGNPMSSYMIHTIQMYAGGAMGNYRTEVSPYIEHIKGVDETFLRVIAEELVKSKKESISERALRRTENYLSKYFHSGDKYLTAEDALAVGVIDKIEMLRLPLLELEEIDLYDERANEGPANSDEHEKTRLNDATARGSRGILRASTTRHPDSDANRRWTKNTSKFLG